MSAPVDDFDLDIRLGPILEGLIVASDPPTERRSFCQTYCASACTTGCRASDCVCTRTQ